MSVCWTNTSNHRNWNLHLFMFFIHSLRQINGPQDNIFSTKSWILKNRAEPIVKNSMLPRSILGDDEVGAQYCLGSILFLRWARQRSFHALIHARYLARVSITFVGTNASVCWVVSWVCCWASVWSQDSSCCSFSSITSTSPSSTGVHKSTSQPSSSRRTSRLLYNAGPPGSVSDRSTAGLKRDPITPSPSPGCFPGVRKTKSLKTTLQCFSLKLSISYATSPP